MVGISKGLNLKVVDRHRGLTQLSPLLVRKRFVELPYKDIVLIMTPSSRYPLLIFHLLENCGWFSPNLVFLSILNLDSFREVGESLLVCMCVEVNGYLPPNAGMKYPGKSHVDSVCVPSAF